MAQLNKFITILEYLNVEIFIVSLWTFWFEILHQQTQLNIKLCKCTSSPYLS